MFLTSYRGERSPAILLPGPVVHNPGADQEVVLVIVGGIGERAKVVVDLHNPHGKMRI